MLYIFIDESGVHKLEGQSAVVLVYVSVADIHVLNQGVLEAERALKIETFHWSHSAWDVRERFIEAILKQDFSVKIIFVKNPFREQAGYAYALGFIAGERD